MEKKTFDQKKTFKGPKPFGHGKTGMKKFGKLGQQEKRDKKREDNDADIREKEKKQEEVSFKKKRYSKEEFEAVRNKYVKKYKDYTEDNGINLSDYEERNSGVTTVKFNLDCLPDQMGKIPAMMKVGQNVTFKVYKSRYSDNVAVLLQSMDGRKALLKQNITI